MNNNLQASNLHAKTKPPGIALGFEGNFCSNKTMWLKKTFSSMHCERLSCKTEDFFEYHVNKQAFFLFFEM